MDFNTSPVVNKSILSSHVSNTSGLSANLRALNLIDVKRQKEVLRLEYEAKQRRFADKWELTQQRTADLAIRRQVEKCETIARNEERRSIVQERLDVLSEAEYYKKLDLIAKLRNRDQKKTALMAERKRTKLAEKRQKQFQRYWAAVDRQNEVSKRRAALVQRCLDPNFYGSDSEEETDEIEAEEQVQEESAERCAYIQRVEKIPGVDREWKYEDRQFRVKLMERIEIIRTNFNTCNQGVLFWEKVAPLWDRMTQCLKETLSNDKSELDSQNAQKSSIVHIPLPPLMLQIMMDGVDYNLTDPEMVEILLRAKEMAGPTATGLEIIRLTRLLVQHEADAKAIAKYMIVGLGERAVFEFIKRDVSKVIFVDMRKAVDRMQHVNDQGVIPDKTVIDNDVPGMAARVYDLISDDKAYGRFDLPIDDEQAYADVMAISAKTKMLKFLSVHDPLMYQAMNNPDPKFRYTMTTQPMPCKEEWPELVAKTIEKFLELAHNRTALFMATNRPKKQKKPEDEVRPELPRVGMRNVYRISRKVTKLAFDMFISDEVMRSDEVEAADSFRMMVANRSPYIKFDRHVYKTSEKVDAMYFLKRFVNPRLA